MTSRTELIIDLISRVEAAQPELISLAEMLSLAVIVEPALIRAARVQYVPAADAGTEADLWLSPLIESSTPIGLTFDKDVVRLLWARLARDPGRLNKAWWLTETMHIASPPTVHLAEELTWLGLATLERNREQRIDEGLRQVLVALVRDGRASLAGWALRVLPRLPPDVALAKSFAPLCWASEARASRGHAPLEIPDPSAFDTWLPAVLPPFLAATCVGVLRSLEDLIFTVPPNKASYSIDLPKTDPLVLRLRQRAGDELVVVIAPKGETRCPIKAGPVTLTSANGDEYDIPADNWILEADRPAAAFSEPPSSVDVVRLGAIAYDHGVNFSLFSMGATRVDLCLFSADGHRELSRLSMTNRNGVWAGYLAGAAGNLIYGYRVDGLYNPEVGDRFNPNKLLIDPYAKRLVGDFIWDPAVFGYNLEHDDLDISFSSQDSAPFVPKACVVKDDFDWGNDRYPRTPWERSIIYQVHVRGYTKMHPDVPPQLRGTYKGLGSKTIIQHLTRLGVTAVNLLPVSEFVDASYLLDQGLSEYWGFNPIVFFAPTARYAVDDPVREFKEMVASFHEAGIEVILDVTYTYTAEGSELGPTWSFRGIDNARYYQLLAGAPRYYINDTGSGNTVNVKQASTQKLVIDSLRYWAAEMHVDGFRFDLATLLGRDDAGFSPDGLFFNAVKSDPVLSKVKLIAEPWDLGPGGYQMGQFPPGWAEWNDRFRDAARSFWRGDDGGVAELAMRLSASGDMFNSGGREAWASINFVTSHQGFTLQDLVSYDHKHNEANGEEGRDGHSNNLSWNCGAEGETKDSEVEALRERQKRNLLVTLLLSHGTPMLQGGDEMSRTQLGNNNAYCQDNEITWMDWRHAGGSRDMTVFIARLVELRREMESFSRGGFLKGTSDTREVCWLAAEGREMSEEDWIDVTRQTLGMQIGTLADVRRLLLLFNAAAEPASFLINAEIAPGSWRPLIDTSFPTGRPVGPGLYTLKRSGLYYLEPHTAAVLTVSIEPGVGMLAT